MTKRHIAVLLAIALLLAGWGQVAAARVASAEWMCPQFDGARDRLTLEELMAVEYIGDSPIDNGYFVPVGDSAPALHPFEGTLTVPWTEMGNTAPQRAHESNEGLRWFPPFSVPLFSHEGYLVPAERGVLCPSEPHYWCVILSPGRIWSEPGDDGMSRASFPFVLVNEWSNNTHNGLASFLYDDAGASSLRLQITQETDPEEQYDFGGQTPVEYAPGVVENREGLVAQFAEELARQVPIRPWAELEGMYDVQVLDRFAGYLAPEEISAAGLVIDDVLYLQPTMTRYGEYPYPRYMRHGVYSVTKSMGAAMTMLRLAQKYGDQVFGYRIADYVEVTADHDGWDEVTFGDALSMATGVGETTPQPGNPNYSGDEREPRFTEFIRARSAREKLGVVFTYPNYPWGPGEVTCYNSINTFALSAAMDSFLKELEGPDAHLWDMVSEEVFRPIGVYHLPTMHTVESNGRRGIPLLFMGVYPTVDDTAKLAILLQNEGQHNGEQLLHAAMLEEALYQRGLAGLPTGYRFPDGDWAYHLSFHSVAYATEDGRYFQVPFMAGMGGNTIVVAPNSISGFVFTDANRSEPYVMTQVAEALRPFPGEGTDLDRLLLVPQGIRARQDTRQLLLMLDRALLVWFALTAAALAIFVYDQVRGTPAAWRVRLAWFVVILFLGPLGLLAYWFSYRQPARSPEPQAATTHSRRAQSATAYSLAGYAIAIILLQVLFDAILDPLFAVDAVVALLMMYALPFLIGLLIFRAPLVAKLAGGGYWPAIQRSLLAEIISVNLALAAALPVLRIPANSYPLLFGPLGPPRMGLFSLAALAIALVLYPYSLWLVRRGFAVWPVWAVTKGEAGREHEPAAMPSLRNAWVALLVSIVLLVASIGLTMVALS